MNLSETFITLDLIKIIIIFVTSMVNLVGIDVHFVIFIMMKF